MLVEPITNNKITIRLSNTESVNQNIFKYNGINFEKESKGKSSTCNYFLTTKESIGDKIKKIVNINNALFICDIKKTIECINAQCKLLENEKIKCNFTGNLSTFYKGKEEILKRDKNFNIGIGIVREDSKKRFNLYFDNSNTNQIMFRNSIIAVFCDIVIEKSKEDFIIYPKIKEEISNYIDCIELYFIKNTYSQECRKNISNDKIIEEINVRMEKLMSIDNQIDKNKLINEIIRLEVSLLD